MKLTIDQAAFTDAVVRAARQLPRTLPHPVLMGLKLTADKKAGGHLAIVGFDYDVSTSSVVAADVPTEGSVLVSGRMLADIAKALPKGQEVHLSTDNTHMLLECGRSRFTLPLLPLEEYPALPELPPSCGSVDAAAFAHAVAQVHTAVGRDEALPALTGIHLKAGEDHLVLFATDRYRFARASVPWSCAATPDKADILIPGKPLLDLAKEMAEEEGSITLHLPGTDTDLIGLTVENLSVTSRLLSEQLPDYERVAPTEFGAVVRVEGAALVAAVKRAATVINRETPIFLDCTRDGIEISAGTSDDARAVDGVDAVLEEGEAMKLAFNPGFLAECLTALDASEVQLNLSTPVKPAVVHGAVGDDGDDATPRFLLMPIRTAETAPKDE